MPIFNNQLAGAAGQGGADAAYQIDRSLRFNDDDSAHLSRNFSAEGNRKTWTWSGWLKQSGTTTQWLPLFEAYDGSSRATHDFLQITFYNNQIGVANDTVWFVRSQAVYRDYSAWMHVVVSFNTTESVANDRVKVYINGERLEDFTTATPPSLNTSYGANRAITHRIGKRYQNNYFDGYLADVHFIDGQALDPTDFGEYDSNNVWQPKAYSGSYGTNGFHLDFSDNSSDQALGYDAAVTQPTLNPRGGMDVITYTGNGSTQTIGGLAFQPDFLWIKSRSNAYYHILVDSVRGNTKELYSNDTTAEQTTTNTVTSFDSNGFSLGSRANTNQSSATYVAWAWKAGGPAELNEDGSIDSQVSVSTDYGFSIVSYTGTGSNATVGHGLSSAPKWVLYKSRGDANDWMVFHTSMGATKSMKLNSNGAEAVRSTTFNNTAPTDSVLHVGTNASTNNTNSAGMIAYCWSEVSGFSKFGSYTGNGSSDGPTITTGFKPRWILVKRSDSTGNWYIFDTARDSDNVADKYLIPNSSGGEGTFTFAEITSTGFKVTDSSADWNANGGTILYAAFADRPGNNWTPNNLIAEAGLETASQGMDVVLYTGNESTQSVTGLDFQPDFVWIKPRTQVNEHVLVDVVRGAGYRLFSNQTNAENYQATSLTSFDSSGFSLGSHTSVNKSSINYVAWCWKAGGTASSNTDGSITSSVSANTTYGFSIVSYTGNGTSGATVGHGLGTVPSFVVQKDRDATTNWQIYHAGAQASGALQLKFTTAAAASNTSVWNNTAPSSSVITLGNGGTNTSGNDQIIYCWSEVPGFSKFGSYEGNGSSTGPVVTLGFKPRVLIIKYSSTSGTDWLIFDSARDSNTIGATLYPNGNYAENDVPAVDFLDDGFQIKTNTTRINTSGGTYIYAAFASKPPGEIIDSLIDTPTNYEASSGNNGGNYATLNPLNLGNATLSNGNLDCSINGSGGKWGAASTIGVTSGKFYMEVTCVTTAHANTQIGVGDREHIEKSYATELVGSEGQAVYYRSYEGNKRVITNGSASDSSYGNTYTRNDIIGIALNADDQEVTFYKNGTAQNSGTAISIPTTSQDIFLSLSEGASEGPDFACNFGQRPFAFTPPTGYKSLCTQNLTDPTIADGSTAMDATLWTGNGSTQSISGLSMSPDLVWIKQRNAASDHNLFDIVRGVQKRLLSNSNAAEGTISTGLTAFNSDGWTMGSSGNINGNNNTYVGWAWDGGTTTATNTDGSITSNVRANQSAGFSIVTYTGNNTTSTVGHGLNATPSLVIVKSRSATSLTGWMTRHSSLSSNYNLALNLTDAAWNPATNGFVGDLTSSTTFSLVKGSQNGNNVNQSGVTYVAYCFAPVAGYSAFGTYTGNGSSDGPFVYTGSGFRPRWVMIKRTDGADSWQIMDAARSDYNVADDQLYADLNIAEASTSTRAIDFLSNGFKVRGNNAGINASGGTYIYAAFAEHPFKTARAR